ncbi:MAG TPA: UbiA family prenyltransferase [Candidatus Goldiibacteriota bacterium]|nr:UbiA family prenyltransferase [Candidatus Goldiibacteriota bacterium]HPN64248.1 UbiA family prenyltransferase [Candidatus Goldiibacteriota bacterium]HRQ43949.1 UbiA family prenyltransferase [Candidatus Goldiibacteriota bacterium]
MSAHLIILILLALSIIYLFIKNGSLAMRFILKLKFTRHVYYTSVFFLGMLLAFSTAKITADSLGTVQFFYGALLINLLFAASEVLNDIYDVNIDIINNKKNTLLGSDIQKNAGLKVFFGLFLFSLSFASLSGAAVFVTALLIHALSYFYSAPPLRLKAKFPANAFLIGFASIAALFCGFTFVTGSGFLNKFPYYQSLILFAALTCAFTVKDINDYEGDKKNNIMTLPVLFGKEKGRKITAFAALFSYLFLPAALKAYFLLVPGAIFGSATAVLIYFSEKKLNESLVFLFLFLFCLSCFALCSFYGKGCIPGIY